MRKHKNVPHLKFFEIIIMWVLYATYFNKFYFVISSALQINHYK